MQGEDGQIFKCQRVRGRAEDRPRQESLIYPAAVHETGYWRDRVLARPHRQRRLGRIEQDQKSGRLRVAGVGRLVGGGRSTAEGSDRSRVLTRGSDFWFPRCSFWVPGLTAPCPPSSLPALSSGGEAI